MLSFDNPNFHLPSARLDYPNDGFGSASELRPGDKVDAVLPAGKYRGCSRLAMLEGIVVETVGDYCTVTFSKDKDRSFSNVMRECGLQQFTRDQDAEGKDIAGTGHTVGVDEVTEQIRRGNIRLLGRT
jgi:hypothetical protein